MQRGCAKLPRTCRWQQEQRTPSALHRWSSKRDSQRKPEEEEDEKGVRRSMGKERTLKPGASSCATGDRPFSVTRAAWASDMMMGLVELVGGFFFWRWMNGNRFLRVKLEG